MFKKFKYTLYILTFVIYDLNKICFISKKKIDIKQVDFFRDLPFTISYILIYYHLSLSKKKLSSFLFNYFF